MTKEEITNFEHEMIRNFADCGIVPRAVAVDGDKLVVVLKIPRGCDFGFNGGKVLSTISDATEFLLRNALRENGVRVISRVRRSKVRTANRFDGDVYHCRAFACTFAKQKKAKQHGNINQRRK